MTSRKTSSAQAELVLLPNLRNCLLNLPSPLVAVLLNSNTLAQNVVVELSYRVPQQTQQQQQDGAKAHARPTSSGGGSITKSVFLGWTGMQSQPKLAPVVGGGAGRDALAAARSGGRVEEREVVTVEVDATFGRLVGLGEGMKVRCSLL